MNFTNDVQAAKTARDLVERFRYLRDGAAHFVLDVRDEIDGPVYFSSGAMKATYSAAAAVLLKYVDIETRQLSEYYQDKIAPRLNVGWLMLPQIQFRERYRLIAPDDDDSPYWREKIS